MRITDVEAVAIRLPNPAGTYWGAASWGVGAERPTSSGAPAHERFVPSYDSTLDTVLVRISTDSGLVGFGEAKAPVVPEVTRDIILNLLRDRIFGCDPRDVVALWDRLYGSMWLRGHRSGFLFEAIAGVDTALWDLIGKHTGESVSRLLGGRYRDRVPVYASGIPGKVSGVADRSRIETEVRRLRDAGYGGVKIGGGQGVDVDLEAAEIATTAATKKVRVFFDAAARYDYGQAALLADGLARLGIGWLEAPLPAENIDDWVHLRARSPVPLATDLLVNRWEVLEYLTRAACDVIQPDVSRAGGLTECRRIADLTTAFGRRVVPHISIGSVVHVAASIHFASTLPTLEMMEFWIGVNPLNGGDLGDALTPQAGSVPVPEGPGLGVEVDWDRVVTLARP